MLRAVTGKDSFAAEKAMTEEGNESGAATGRLRRWLTLTRVIICYADNTAVRHPKGVHHCWHPDYMTQNILKAGNLRCKEVGSLEEALNILKKSLTLTLRKAL